MAATDDLLTCLALERRAYALLCRWEMASSSRDPQFDLLGRLADECDRYRTLLRELCLSHQLAIPPLPELEVEASASFPILIKSALRELLQLLPGLENELTGKDRSQIAQIRHATETQVTMLMTSFPDLSNASARASVLRTPGEERLPGPSD